MPPTGAETKVNDPEYINWLKVGLSLYYLKDGLQSFIEEEVGEMHKDLLRILHEGVDVPEVQCSTCCLSKPVLQNFNGDAWMFPQSCPFNLCDAWLTELIAWHREPTSNRIYWENCNIKFWPFNPWECAKLYMPRGQEQVTGPGNSDSQALLTLMINCKHFHEKLSHAGLHLAYKVSRIRNRVMHSGDMSLSDYERQGFIRDVIQLLEDPVHLSSLNTCKKAVCEINKIENDSVDVFFDVGEQIKALKEAVNAVRQDLGMEATRTSDSVESLKEEYRQLTEQLRIKLEAVENRMDTVENTIDTVENRMDTVENWVYTVENTIDTVENRQDTDEIRMETVENRQDTLERDLQSVMEQMDTAQQQQVELSQAMSESVATLEVRVGNVDRNLQEIGQRTDQHEKFIQEIKASTTQGTDQVSAEKMKSGTKKLRDDLIKAYRNLRCVQVSPIFEKRRCDIDNIYVDLVVEEKQESKNTEEESKYVTQHKNAQPHSRKIIKVTSYKQVFLDEQGLKFKRVYLRGKGGLGKTTFCRKVLHDWCNAHENRVTAQDRLFQDKAVLKTFDLLFYMNLREVSLEKNLIEVICTQFPLEEIPDQNVLGTLLKANGDKVLFILDGLDEMIVKPKFLENVVTRRVYPNCCFLVSSRPWKISQMELQEGTEIDLLLDLKGFSKENVRKCAKKIFKICYKDGNVIENFMEDIEGNKLAMQLIHVPLLLLFLAQVWYENKRSLPSKLHELYILFLNLLTDRVKEKYRKDPNHRQTRFTLGDMQSPLPSKIYETSLVVNFGEGLLLSLCEVAHHFLLRSQKENSLVFEETKLLNVLGDRGEEKLNIALDLGVLSVTDSVSYLNRKTNVSFLHKTMQEFFTALCLILSPDKLSDFVSSMADLNDVLQNENIIVFLFGLTPELGNRVLKKVNELYRFLWDGFRNEEEQKMLKSDSRFEVDLETYMWSNDFSDTNSIYSRCIEEVTGENVLLNVSCLCLADKILDTHSLNLAFLQILDLTGWDEQEVPDYRVDLSEFKGLTYLALRSLTCELYLPALCSLSVLIVEDVTLARSCCKVLGRTMTNHTKLKRIWIDNTDLHNCKLDFSKMTELTHLYMSDVTLSEKCCDLLGRTLAHCTKLERLGIHTTELHNFQLDLSKMKELTHLYMSFLTLSSRCSLAHCTKLERLGIYSTDLHNCQLELSKMTELTHLYMSDSCAVLGSTLAHCTKLKKLKICLIELHNFQSDFSKMTELTHLYMFEVTLSSSCCDILGKLLKHCTKLKKLKIHDTNLHNCLLDLSNMTELMELEMLGVTLSSGCCDVLGESLTHCSKLESLTIRDMDLHNCPLDVSNMTELRFLWMEIKWSDSSCVLFRCTLPHTILLKFITINGRHL